MANRILTEEQIAASLIKLIKRQNPTIALFGNTLQIKSKAGEVQEIPFAGGSVVSEKTVSFR